jgi:hypothetical protein
MPLLLPLGEVADRATAQRTNSQDENMPWGYLRLVRHSAA